MSKKGRLFIILLVLAMCFVFLWPSICWYARTPKDDKALALSSLEKIKEYATFMAENDVEQLRQAAKASDAEIPAGSEWLVKAAKKNFKDMGKEVPSPLTLRAALETFSREELTKLVEDRYRNKILKDKKNYKNSVKLGLDLSGGMNVIVKADLDAVVKAQKESGTVAEASWDSDLKTHVVTVNEATLRNDAMAQAIETLTSRIDRFGLSSPTIRQQGEDRIYIELPGSAETDQINSIIQGRGILNFRLVDMDATEKFLQYYFANRSTTFDSKGKAASFFAGRISIAGHSKGGNLAIYAAVNAGKKIQNRLFTVYNNDGPGFSEGFFRTEEYLGIREKIRSYFPQLSIIGMLFCHDSVYTTVESDNEGLYQHDPFSWHTQALNFVRKEDTTEQSKFIASTVNQWIQEIPTEEREVFIEAIFSVLNSTKARTNSELSSNIFSSAKTMFKSYSRLSPQTRNTVGKVLQLLFKVSVSNIESSGLSTALGFKD